jgi:hypothetical protein
MIDNQQQNLVNLLQEIYDNEGTCWGIEYFSQYLEELKKYDFSAILARQTRYPIRYVISFILSTPSLWIQMSDTEWVRVMSALNPRPEPYSREIFIEGYVDIHFLCKYLGINSIDLFLQQEQFSSEDKKKILQYSRKVVIFLFTDELDLQNLNGDYFVHKDELDKVRANLLSSGKIKPFTFTEAELKKYLEKELENYL